MSLTDTFRRFLGIREPTKEDLEMAAKEMDFFMRKDGYVPYSANRKSRFRIRRKRKDDGKVRTVGIGIVIDNEKK